MVNSVVIVPAHNEGPRISSVLSVLSKAMRQGIIKKVIVVNDGSIDNTVEQVRKFPNVELIHFSENKGKGSALMAGFRKAISDKADFAITIDADLKGFNIQRIKELIKSIKNHDMSIGLRENTFSGVKWREWLAIHTSGERIFRVSSLSEVINNPEFKKFIKKRRRFGFDLSLSIIYSKTGRKINLVKLPGVTHTSKKIKIGKYRGSFQNLKMNFQWVKNGIAAKRTASKMKHK